MLFSFGRYAPFYRLIYALPYFSTIRNPVKFIAIFDWAVLILFAFGVHGLFRKYVESASPGAADLSGRLKHWRAKADPFERRWLAGCLIAIAAGIGGWIIYASFRSSLEQYLQTVQIDEDSARAIASFSIRQVGWFILSLALATSILILIMIGSFAGKRAKWAGILLGLVVVADLARADQPWIVYWDYKQKYASNPVIDLLRQKPYEHRVAILPFNFPNAFEYFLGPGGIYRIEWVQHHFQYYNIQSLDIIQMPRTPADLAAYQAAMAAGGLTRYWQLTNTRYLFGAAIWPTQNGQVGPFVDVLNQQLDPARHRFRLVTGFNVVSKPGVANPTRLEELTVEPGPATNSLYALFEFTGALPRAKLYTNWKVCTNSDPAGLAEWVKTTQARVPKEWANALASFDATDQATLKELASDSFNPNQTVLLAKPLASAASSAHATNGPPAQVDFTSYAPKDIQLKTTADAASILLLNDKYDPAWHAWVDGQPTELLRCNFIMRGVFLPAGSHRVEFRFQPDTRPMYVSIAAVGVGILLLGYLGIRSRAKDA